MSEMTIQLQTSTTDQTMQVGELIARCCSPGDIIALQGELGAGKTQLVRGLAQGLGLNPRQVSSPTFVMVQEYEQDAECEHKRDTEHKRDSPLLVHIDAYRIHSPDELESIGWVGHGQELRDNAVVAIEWAKLIRPALGDDLLWVQIEHAPQQRRHVSISAEGSWRDKIHPLYALLNQHGVKIIEDEKAT